MLYLIRYGELALKSKTVRRKFEDILLKNIKNVLGKEAKVANIYGRFLVESEYIDPLKRVFGVVSFSPCWKTSSSLDDIKNLCLEKIKLKKGETFAVRCNRIGNHEYSSQDIEKNIGSSLLEKFANKVNLSKPDKTVSIDIRNKDAYLYTDIFQGSGGLPIGTAGKVGCFVENENDTIASWLFMKRGCEVVFSGKVELAKDLEKWNSGKPLIFGEKENLPLIKGDTKLENWKDNTLTFRPLIGFSQKQTKSLMQRIKN